MTEPISPATLRALADELDKTHGHSHGRDCQICHAADVVREAAASLTRLDQLTASAVENAALYKAAFARAEAAEALCATLRSQLHEEQEKNVARVDGSTVTPRQRATASTD